MDQLIGGVVLAGVAVAVEDPAHRLDLRFVAVFVPVFGLLIGITVLGERPDGWTVTGIVLVLLSMRVRPHQA